MAKANLAIFKTSTENALNRSYKTPGRKKKPIEKKAHNKRPLSLTDTELQQLEEAAMGIPIATFVKNKLYEAGILKMI